MLSHSRIGTIGSDQNITMVGLVVMATDHDTVIVLHEVKNLLVHVNLLFRDLAQEQIIQIWASYL